MVATPEKSKSGYVGDTWAKYTLDMHGTSHCFFLPKSRLLAAVLFRRRRPTRKKRNPAAVADSAADHSAPTSHMKGVYNGKLLQSRKLILI